MANTTVVRSEKANFLHKSWLLLCSFLIWSQGSTSAQVEVLSPATNTTAYKLRHLGADTDYYEGVMSLQKKEFKLAAASFRKSLQVNNQASGHVALGNALLGIAETSDNSETQSMFKEAISQFEFFPLAVLRFQRAGEAYIQYLKSHKKNNEAEKFSKSYQPRLKMLRDDAHLIHTSKPWFFDKYEHAGSIITK